MDGEDAVKASGELFLSRIREDDSPAQYDAYKALTSFYPATTKIAQGILGLIFRKKAQLNSTSARVQALSRTIGPRGQSLDDFMECLVRETLITNFTGVLVDHPDATDYPGMSLAEQERRGIHARFALYAFESILEARYGDIDGHRKLVRVRLLERDGRQVRRLLINGQGQYEQQVFLADDDGRFSERPTRTSIPTVDDQPMTELPFNIISNTESETPTPSLLTPSVDLNLDHYRWSGLLANIAWLTTSPIAVITGFERAKNEQGVQIVPPWDISPGAVWEFPSSETSVEWFIYDPKGAELIKGMLADRKSELSTLGHSILAPEKAAPESPDTQMLRRSAENATLAGFTRAIGRKITPLLNRWAGWVDPTAQPLDYALNTDFLPNAMSPQEMVALQNLWLAGGITHEQLLHALVDGEVLSSALDIDREIELTKSEVADRPPTGTTTDEAL